ncbi:hypothetical protein K1719_044995 [Acacia pycnantha]|nr:hypothetical protein K1719_044995 [Acacia pycnantha]
MDMDVDGIRKFRGSYMHSTADRFTPKVKSLPLDTLSIPNRLCPSTSFFPNATADLMSTASFAENPILSPPFFFHKSSLLSLQGYLCASKMYMVVPNALLLSGSSIGSTG